MVTPTQPISVQHFDALYSINCLIMYSGGGFEAQGNCGVKLQRISAFISGSYIEHTNEALFSFVWTPQWYALYRAY